MPGTGLGLRENHAIPPTGGESFSIKHGAAAPSGRGSSKKEDS